VRELLRSLARSVIGFDDMLPVYVERKWQGKTGSLSWCLPVTIDVVLLVKTKS
jgi:hypothetical protein